MRHAEGRTGAIAASGILAEFPPEGKATPRGEKHAKFRLRGLISSGKYGTKGGVSAKQLWYGGNGTCVSGALMMDDFMKDLGINSKVKFMGNKGGSVDIYGYSIMYMSQHKNTWIRLGGKRYELNAQPGGMWPIGTVKR